MATTEKTETDLKPKFLTKVQEFGCSNEKLAGNFFTAIDLAIKKSEADRASNQYKANDPKIKWAVINFDDVLQKSIAYSNLGIDPLAKDMLSFIFYKNKSLGYDITFVEGVKCMETLARRYGINCPENITVELIYSNDEFSLIKKDISNPEDGYILNIKTPFDRGSIVGGVSLSEYKNTKYNKSRLMTRKDILKRTKETTAFFKNWEEEMCEKTIAKNAWSKVVLNTTELAEYYATQPNDVEFEPENTEELPFDPNAEL